MYTFNKPIIIFNTIQSLLILCWWLGAVATWLAFTPTIYAMILFVFICVVELITGKSWTKNIDEWGSRFLD